MDQEAINKCYKEWDDFLNRWPIESLNDMTLEQYVSGNPDSFCYWLEQKTGKLGGIRGGNAVKFGIYRPVTQKETKNKTDGEYVWAKNRNADTAQEAFEMVKANVIKIAEASANGDWNTIDRIKFANNPKWKIAFLYQKRDYATIPCVYDPKILKQYLKSKGENEPLPNKNLELYPLILHYRKQGEDIFAFSEPIWNNNATQSGDMSNHESATESVAENASSEPNPSVSDEMGEPYTKEQFLQEVFMEQENYEVLKQLLLRKNNIILSGAPGVGKTYAAKRLAWSILGYRSARFVRLIQFHQSYSYEDFIRGYKPDGAGFTLKDGVFYRFCMDAKNHPGHDYFFLIDEINRGNLSKIFGELLMLLERDYRGEEIELAYSREKDPLFRVPKNVYIIGMMNTADRSLALIDYALRRRFGVFFMVPRFDLLQKKLLEKEFVAQSKFESVTKAIIDLNKDIESDSSLGKGFCIGHSYFCIPSTIGDERIETPEAVNRWLQSVILYDIVPLLEEYWFDNADKVNHWESRLMQVLTDGTQS